MGKQRLGKLQCFALSYKVSVKVKPHHFLTEIRVLSVDGLWDWTLITYRAIIVPGRQRFAQYCLESPGGSGGYQNLQGRQQSFPSSLVLAQGSWRPDPSPLQTTQGQTVRLVSLVPRVSFQIFGSLKTGLRKLLLSIHQQWWEILKQVPETPQELYLAI